MLVVLKFLQIIHNYIVIYADLLAMDCGQDAESTS